MTIGNLRLSSSARLNAKLNVSKVPVVLGLPLCPVNMNLTWLGKKSEIIAKKVQACVTWGLLAVRSRTVFRTNPVFSSYFKDGLKKFCCL